MLYSLYANRSEDWRAAGRNLSERFPPGACTCDWAGHEAVFELNRPLGGVAVRENYGFARREIAAIERALVLSLNALLTAWERIHGER
jgi:hypothetical protein